MERIQVDIKIELAKELIARFHDDQSANLAEVKLYKSISKRIFQMI